MVTPHLWGSGSSEEMDLVVCIVGEPHIMMVCNYMLTV